MSQRTPRPPRRRRRSALVAALVALAASTAALVVPAAPASAATRAVPTPPALVWTTCSNPTLASFGAQCTYVTVPKDYADASAGTIKLAVSRVLHTTKTYQGVVLVNPGGPGGSGLIYSILQKYVPNGGGLDYDWIGFDPRGVGSSIPALKCDPTYFAYDRPDYVATSDALQNYWVNRSAQYSQSCAAKNDLDLLRNMTTEDNARDMDSIRLALGQSQINYYGYSYGTYLGQTYATMFPTHLRRAVLDSNVDPTRVFYDTQLDQDKAFQVTSGKFFAWVAQHDSTYHLGDTQTGVQAAYYGILDQLRRQPQNHGKVGPDEWTDAFLPAGYYQSSWTDVASIFYDAVHDGDYTGVTSSIEGPKDSDNGFAVYLATQCTDAPWPKSYTKTWKPDAVATDKVAPFETWGNVWFNSPCITWPAPSQPRVAIGSSTAPGMLLVDEQYDAATPYAGSLETRTLFPNSSLIEVVGGTTHATTLFAGNSCTDNAIARYLKTGALPARGAPDATADKKCPAEAEPEPDAVTAATAGPALPHPGVITH